MRAYLKKKVTEKQVLWPCMHCSHALTRNSFILQIQGGICGCLGRRLSWATRVGDCRRIWTFRSIRTEEAAQRQKRAEQTTCCKNYRTPTSLSPATTLHSLLSVNGAGSNRFAPELLPESLCRPRRIRRIVVSTTWSWRAPTQRPVIAIPFAIPYAWNVTYGRDPTPSHGPHDKSRPRPTRRRPQPSPAQNLANWSDCQERRSRCSRKEEISSQDYCGRKCCGLCRDTDT